MSDQGQCSAKGLMFGGISLGGQDWTQPWTITGFFYRYFLGNQYAREGALNMASPEMLKEAIKHAQDSKLKKDIYATIRQKSYSSEYRNTSIIINEIKGMYDFARGTANYLYWTAKMHL